MTAAIIRECQRRALMAAEWDTFPQRREAARREGRLLGIGLANYVEGTGRGPFESTAIRIGPSGQIVVATGATAQGQGAKTMLAQLAASVFGVSADVIHVVDGDTAATPFGLGAFASRQAVTAGNAAYLAALSVAEKAKAAASAMLEVAPEDLELKDGEVRVAGVPKLKKQPRRDRTRARRPARLRAARQYQSRSCGGGRLSADGHDLYQRHPHRGSRGESDFRRGQDSPLHRGP